MCFVRRFHAYVLVFVPRVGYLGGTRETFGLVLVSDGQNEGNLNNGSDIYCSACSPLLWDNLGLFHMYMSHDRGPIRVQTCPVTSIASY